MNHHSIRHRLIIGPLGAAVLGLMICCGGPQEETAGESEIQSASPPVKVVEVQRRRISEKISYTGTIEALKKMNIMPDVGGKIARIAVQEGDRVRKGQVLAELETEAVRLQLRQAEAGVAVARANFEDAKRNKERMDRLIEENAVSEMQYEKIKLAYDAAVAQLEQADAALALARHALDVSIMKAPWSGIVASRNAEEGDVINPLMGSFSPSSGVLTLMDYAKVKIVVDVSPSDVARMAKGQTVLLRTPTSPEHDFRGKTTIVNPTADPLTKKFQVEAQIDNPDGALRPGTFGELVFEVSSQENALVVPQNAILDDSYLFVVRGGKALRKDVVLGLQNTDLVEIVSGIEEGELVIVEGNYGLKDGAPVDVVEEERQ